MLHLVCMFLANLCISGLRQDCHHVRIISALHEVCDAGSRHGRSVVIDYLLNNFANQDTKVVYIYCNYKDQAAQTASNLIACLARQIIGRPKALPQEVITLHEELQQQKRRPSSDELKRLLIAMCNKHKQTYLVVDALDECEASHERRLLLPVLESLPYASTRLFVTSRPNNEDIVQTFSKANQIIIAAPKLNLREYILERMNERRDFVRKLTPELEERIMATVSAGASGMYDTPCPSLRHARG